MTVALLLGVVWVVVKIVRADDDIKTMGEGVGSRLEDACVFWNVSHGLVSASRATYRAELP